MRHSYTKELTAFVTRQWDNPCAFAGRQELIDLSRSDPLPDPEVLEHLISICYQASLLQDEERPVRFRLILQEPEHFELGYGPPQGLHRYVFSQPRPCSEHELRRLSPSTDFYRSLIGIRFDQDRGLQIWGLVHSGPRWTQTLYGGGRSFQPLPNALVIHVTNPGRITVCKGSSTVANLNLGRIICPTADVFDSHWMESSFALSRADVWSQHLRAREQAQTPWAILDPNFLHVIKKQIMMRVIAMIRHLHHGGTMICVPQHRVQEVLSGNRYADLKYRFAEEGPRDRFNALLLAICNALAESYGGTDPPQGTVGWREYLTSKNQRLSRLDEAIFEWAHLVADLSSVDGAVFFTQRFELLGFGGEISGRLDKVKVVAKALDLEGERAELEPTDDVGTRHHSTYRLCNALHDVLGMVVSHDGTVQIVKWKDGAVTCWDQVATSVMDV